MFISINLICQENANDKIQKSWQLEKGWFTEKTLIFKEVKYKNGCFQFKENNSIILDYDEYNLGCNVGLFTLKKGSWYFQQDCLILELKGLKVADFWYWWKIKYDYIIEDNHMILTVCEIMKKKQISPLKQYTDLINEIN